MLPDVQAMTARQQRIFDFLDTNKTGVLATVDPNGDPHAAVIYHLVDKADFTISFLTKSETKKYDNLGRNNHIVLVVFDATNQTVAQITGKASEIKDPVIINKIAQAVCDNSLATSNGRLPPIANLEAGAYAGFQIKPDQIRLAVYSKPRPDNYEDIFETLESFELKPGY